MKHIVLAFDSFKGSLTSREVADAFEEGLHGCITDAVVDKVCIADGGEGTADAIVDTLNGEYMSIEVADPLGRPVLARYGIVDAGATAVIEMAQASGLTLLNEDERNPMLASTYGTGQLMADALNRGCRKMLVCIGGSATNDGGMGMLNALGYRFLDADGNELQGRGDSLGRIAGIDASHRHQGLSETEVIVACDVQNPLYGKSGAAYVFAPQKGADTAMVERLDLGLRNYAEAIRAYCGIDVNQIPGAGAAGGMGAGLMALLGGKLKKGIDMVLDAVDFDNMIMDADVVVTGEGKIDCQTLMGKAPSGVLARAKSQGVPVVAIGGRVEWCDELRQSGFAAIHQITTDALPLETVMRRDVAYDNVKTAAQWFGLQINDNVFPTQ